MTEMDKLWVTVASLLYPKTDSSHLVGRTEVRQEYRKLFGSDLSRRSQGLLSHVISWKARNIDKKNPSRGGSSNRYIFKTEDGANPSLSQGAGYRLYKATDFRFDGEGKDGPTCPNESNVAVEFQFLREWYLHCYLETPEQKNTEENLIEGEIIQSSLSITEKEMLIKSRRGQGIFRTRVAELEPSCRLTGLKNLKFLVASHIKPWAKCDNFERLDGANGLLLSPHVDKLFNDGYITFEENGEVTISSKAIETMAIWGLATKKTRPLTKEQEFYMQYHRKHLFLGR